MRKITIAGCCLLLAGVLVFICGFAAAGWDIRRMSTEPPFEEKTLTLPAETQILEIKDRNVPITVAPSGDAEIHITYFTNENVFYTIKEDTHFIMQKKTDFQWYDGFFNVSFASPRLTILLPEGFAGELQLQTSNHKITLQNISAGKLHLKTSNDTIWAESVAVKGNAELITTNAKISVSALSAGKRLLCKTKNNPVQLKDVHTGDVEVYTTNDAVLLQQVTASGTVDVKTTNDTIELHALAAGEAIRLSSTNDPIRGDIKGEAKDFSIYTHTTNGKSNLPDALELGEKTLEIFTTNADIAVEFRP